MLITMKEARRVEQAIAARFQKLLSEMAHLEVISDLAFAGVKPATAKPMIARSITKWHTVVVKTKDAFKSDEPLLVDLKDTLYVTGHGDCERIERRPVNSDMFLEIGQFCGQIKGMKLPYILYMRNGDNDSDWRNKYHREAYDKHHMIDWFRGASNMICLPLHQQFEDWDNPYHHVDDKHAPHINVNHDYEQSRKMGEQVWYFMNSNYPITSDDVEAAAEQINDGLSTFDRQRIIDCLNDLILFGYVSAFKSPVSNEIFYAKNF